jgi:ABC-type sugar transport system ATPase subunit
MATVKLEHVGKDHGAARILGDVSLDIKDGELLVLVGPSGCGKSTLLRCIAGLETLTRGRVILDGKDVSNDEPRDRDIAMVFQSYALYPHLTVRENLAFGLKMRKTPRDEIARRVGEAAAILGLEALLDRRPAQLSGGQRQRVAMGRAVVRRPKAFLFDEPLSNLDASLRGAMRVELMRLHQKLGATMIYVTHDQVEAMTLADRIAVLQAGTLEQVGAPDELYGRPANLFVARFIGTPEMNVLAASRARELGLCGNLPQDAMVATVATIGARAEAVRLGRPQAQAFRSAGDGATGVVEVVEHLGWEALVHVGLGDASAASELVRVVARVESADAPRPGERVRVTLDGEHVHFFDAAGARLEPKPALRAQP